MKYFFLFSLIIINFSCSKTDNKNKVTIKGSDTMVHLVSQWIEKYHNSSQGDSNAIISITGGGSGTGISALLNKNVDICASSRDIKKRELLLAEKKGLKLKEYSVAIDGIAVVVHPNNPIQNLSLEQIEKIYTGKYTNWEQLGGKNQKIVLLARESSSGTYVFFQKTALNKKDYSSSALLLPTNSAILQTVSKDLGAIGYIGVGYYEKSPGKVKAINIKNKGKTIAPSFKNIKNKSYPLARDLYFYTDEKLSSIAKKFINYTLSFEGQKEVLHAGYIPIQK